MTPEKAEREADETAIALATEMWRRQTGCTNAFDIARPADVLTLRIALEAVRQGMTNTVFPRRFQAGFSEIEVLRAGGDVNARQ